MGLIKPLRWWGYLDDRGVIHVTRYTTDRAIQNCEQMPFCKGIFDPFTAWDYQEARMKCWAKLQEVDETQRKSN